MTIRMTKCHPYEKSELQNVTQMKTPNDKMSPMKNLIEEMSPN